MIAATIPAIGSAIPAVTAAKDCFVFNRDHIGEVLLPGEDAPMSAKLEDSCLSPPGMQSGLATISRRNGEAYLHAAVSIEKENIA